MTLTEYKQKFIRKHAKADWEVFTSPMDEYGAYSKSYVFSDGAQMTEVNRPVFETVEAEREVKGIMLKISESVKLFETEIWSTDDPVSVKFYERW